MTPKRTPRKVKLAKKSYCHYNLDGKLYTIFSVEITGNTTNLSGEVLSGKDGDENAIDTCTCNIMTVWV